MRLLIGILFITLIGCKPSIENVKPESVKGKYVSYVEQGVINFSDGSQAKLNTEKGSKVIYLTRHAEKDTVPAKNPVLTKAGYERANTLAQMFKKTRLDVVYSTMYNRTMHTVDSLVTMKGIGTKIYQPKELKKLGAELLEHEAYNHIMISGHSNTTPAFASVLMGETLFDSGFDESDYDNLLIVNVSPDGNKKMYELKYKVH